MAILTKTQVKNIYVTNAVPTQVDYGNWIDSCVFLNPDGSSGSNYMQLKNISIPTDLSENPPVGYKDLFFYANDYNKLSSINSDGDVERIVPNSLASFYFDENRLPLSHTLFITNKDIKIVSVRLTIIGNTSFTFGLYSTVASGSITGASCNIIDDTLITTDSLDIQTLYNIDIVSDTVAADRIICLGYSSFTGTFQASFTLEYKEI